MTSEELNALITEAVSDRELRSADIPDIDLYLDQILTLTQKFLSPADGDSETERPLTKTMINNYSKDGLIKPVKGKKYSKEHVVQMLLVYYLKGVLSIGEIKRMLCGVEESGKFTDADLIGCYDRFLDIKAEERAKCADLVKAVCDTENLDVSDDRDYFVLLLSACSLSAYMKDVSRALLVARYPDVSPKKGDKKHDREKDSSD